MFVEYVSFISKADVKIVGIGKECLIYWEWIGAIFFSDENLPDEAYFSLDQFGLTSGSIH